MPKSLTATELRANLYRVIDEVLATGKSCRVVRGARAVVIEAESPKRRRRRQAKVTKRSIMRCTFEELVATTWESAWRPEP